MLPTNMDFPSRHRVDMQFGFYRDFPSGWRCNYHRTWFRNLNKSDPSGLKKRYIIRSKLRMNNSGSSNFLFIGSHKTTFYKRDGNIYHKMLLTAHSGKNGYSQFLRDNLQQAEKKIFTQFRYIFSWEESTLRSHKAISTKIIPKAAGMECWKQDILSFVERGYRGFRRRFERLLRGEISKDN